MVLNQILHKDTQQTMARHSVCCVLSRTKYHNNHRDKNVHIHILEISEDPNKHIDAESLDENEGIDTTLKDSMSTYMINNQ